MEKRPVSGMIPLFLSGMGDRGGACRSRTAPLRRLLLVSSGKSPALSSVNRVLAMGLGRHRAAVNLYQIQDQSKDVSAFDGMIMGIAPDGTGRTERALAFLRNHMDLFSAMPVALFFLLGDLPDFPGGRTSFQGLRMWRPWMSGYFRPRASGFGKRCWPGPPSLSGP